MEDPFLPGHKLPRDRPLGRFLPPIERGAVARLLANEGLEGTTVLDPFGSSPQLAVEAAQSGCAVIVAANNPITRFVLERRLDPLSVEELQSTLARLSSVEKDGNRLEPFLMGLYETECLRCGSRVAAEYFVWNAESGEPVMKAYACPHCNHAGEDPASGLDQERAEQYGHRGLPQAQALERVVSVGDRGRRQAEAALSIYPRRALYALVTLLNKSDQMNLAGREAVALRALLLSAFDAVDSMWAHPDGRPRPKQLTASPQFRESNVWIALERAVEAWAEESPGLAIRWWPEDGTPPAGSVSIFAGPTRELATTLSADFDGCVLTVPPRPNQAYWTLSAIWSAWLWGKEVAAPFKAALQRRRYDWGWHASALRQSGRHLVRALPADRKVFTLIPEAEPGFMGACLAGFDAAGLRLKGRALRVDDRQAQFRWFTGSRPRRGISWEAVDGQLIAWSRAPLTLRGEPTAYMALHASAASEVASAAGHGSLWEELKDAPVSQLQRRLIRCLEEEEIFRRLDERQDPETGLYWLQSSDGVRPPLADRVERLVVAALRREKRWDALDLDLEVCRHLPGLETPDRGLVLACLHSYAEREKAGSWTLRPEDRRQAREADLQNTRYALLELGERLDFNVEGHDPIFWRLGKDSVYAFCVLETAMLGEAQARQPERLDLTYVIPGGRAALVVEKARRDPRLRERLEAEPFVVKFRHIRRLLSDTTLTTDNLRERIGIDPPEHQDPQLPLL